MNKSKIDGSQIPPGALLSFVQRGVNFVEIEESLANGTENGAAGTSAMDGVTSLLDVHKCLCSDDFKRSVSVPAARPRANSTENADGMEIDDVPAGNSTGAGDRRKDIDIPITDTLTLRGHSSEVFVCTWNPTSNLLASASGDSTARIWPIPNSISSPLSSQPPINPIILNHPEPDVTAGAQPRQSKANDVTTLSWNPTGQVLATGCYDGCARLWTPNGELKHTLKLHKGPLFSLKWNKTGSRILSGSVDATTAVWEGDTGKLVRQFRFHSQPTLDVDWRDDSTFASCSTDKMIYLCDMNQEAPVQTYEGHKDEINCLQFDPSGTLLASCSDDFTAKVWTATSPNWAYNLREHHREVYTLQWAPNHKDRLILATASFDATVKLWDVTSGKSVRTLANHTDPVYSLDFSPNAEFLATGSFDRCINIWSVKDGKLLKKFRGDGGIFEVTWNPAGDKVAACFSSNTVTVLDMRKLVATSTKLG